MMRIPLPSLLVAAKFGDPRSERFVEERLELLAPARARPVVRLLARGGDADGGEHALEMAQRHDDRALAVGNDDVAGNDADAAAADGHIDLAGAGHRRLARRRRPREDRETEGL